MSPDRDRTALRAAPRTVAPTPKISAMLTDKKILPKLRHVQERYTTYLFEPVSELRVKAVETAEHLRLPPGDQADWQPVTSGFSWGAPWGSAWFRTRTQLPESCSGKRIYICAETGAPEAMLVVDGTPNGVFDPNHPVVMLTSEGDTEHTYDIAIEAYAGTPCVGSSPNAIAPPRDEERPARFRRTFQQLSLLLAREDVIAFVFDLRVLLDLVETLPDHSLRRGRITSALQKIYTAVDAMPGETEEARWRPKLAAARRLMQPLLRARNGDTTPTVGIIGHSHIDTAWLWTIAETERKCARTFSSILNLMRQYPEFTFIQSAPCHMEMVQQYYPELLDAAREAVARGTWEVNGAMYVEPDCNIPSGESFVRQLLFGQRATEALFGVRSDTFWQPDVFGYSAALPQILQGCGVEFFLTTKLSWNDTTRLPYDTFTWKGIDGSSVITHFNKIHCWPDPKTLASQWRDVQHPDVQDRHLCSFGFGDGGGGPQFEMLEVARRVGDLEGCPKGEYTTVSSFMQGVRDELDCLPVWNGELYLELHRGTLTSIAGVKKGNRKSEIALRNAELAWTLAALQGATYPTGTLNGLWKTLLINQFHDILPGSSIPAVNDQAIRELSACQTQAAELAVQGLQEAHPADTGGSAAVLLANSLSWDRTGECVVRDIADDHIPAIGGTSCQRIVELDGTPALVVSGLTVPALATLVIPLTTGEPEETSPFKVRKQSLETPFAKVRFDRLGRIASFVDKRTRRELVTKGGGLNTLWIGEDIPANWDNWDVDYDQALKMQAETRLVARTVVADGPLQLRLQLEYELGDASRVVQHVVFHSTTARVDFETAVDWQEKHKLLKAGFTVDVLAATARHEIQYGHLERPTHENRPADRAQFEICNHKWTDLSESRFGIALLNDCKYGLSVRDGDMRLTLLKSGTHPDPRGDNGQHAFTYSLLPHDSGFSTESVIRPAYELNMPVLATPTTGVPAIGKSLVQIDQTNVIVEVVKMAEDGTGLVIRLYEAERSGTWCNIGFAGNVEHVAETNMLEESGKPLTVKNSTVSLYFRPFEIKTLKIKTG